MNSKQRASVLFLGLIWVLSTFACTSTRGTATGESEAFPREACFNADKVDSFSPLHGRFVYLRLLGDEHYLLTMDTLYINLPFATDIRLASDFKRVCSDSGATLTFTEGGHRVVCRIIHIEAVAGKEQAQELVAERTAPRLR